jgi:NAD(P)-dependent dehydrogenase (short-subunit alcohol dehydrogenase family)
MTPPPASPWRLDGKVALITGATRGIGRAVVDELIGFGALVVAVARTQRGLDELRDATSGRANPLAADVSTADGRARIVERVRAMGRLDVLVHNAGTNVRGPLVGYDDATIARLIEVNLTAPLLLSRDLHPQLAAAGGASVVHVGSIAGLVALPTGVAYAAAKAGLGQVARTLALEWAKDGIRVNTVAPWYTRTPLVEPVLSDPAKLAAIVARTPLGRVAEPREVATVIAFLALPAASYVTGQHLAVDGGMSIQGLGADVMRTETT